MLTYLCMGLLPNTESIVKYSISTAFAGLTLKTVFQQVITYLPV